MAIARSVVHRSTGAQRDNRHVTDDYSDTLLDLDRSTKLDKDIELLVIKDYDRRNFAVHAGLAGILNLSKTNFEAMCAIALNLIGDCLLTELHILGKEFQLPKAIQNYDTILAEIDRVQVYAFADKTLQSLGEPVSYCVHKGDPPKADRESGKLEKLL